MKGQKRSVFLRFLRCFLTFAVGNGITKKFFGLVIQLPRRGNGITKPKKFLVILLPIAKVRKHCKNRRKTERFCPFMANILMNYALGATLTLCPELSSFGLSARELCGLHENCILSARKYGNLQPYRTKIPNFYCKIEKHL